MIQTFNSAAAKLAAEALRVRSVEGGKGKELKLYATRISSSGGSANMYFLRP